MIINSKIYQTNNKNENFFYNLKLIYQSLISKA